MGSPQVQISENFTQHYIPSVTNETAAFVGHFERGPVDVPVLINRISDFKFIFGRGVGEHYNDWYQVYNYLQYSSGIWVQRSCGTARTNANNGVDLTINRFSEWSNIYDTLPEEPVRFIARTPGSWGNLLSIGVIGIEQYNADVIVGHNLSAKTIFNFFEDGNFGICVFRDGLIVETFYKSLDSLEDLNAESIYLYIKANLTLFPVNILEISDFISSVGTLNLGNLGASTSRDNNGLITSSALIQNVNLGSITDIPQSLSDYLFYGDSLIQFSNGDQMAPTQDDLINSYDTFANTDSFDIDIILGNERDNNLAVQLAEERKDCIAFIGFPAVLIEYLKLLISNGENPNNAYTTDGFVIGLNEFKIPPKLDTLAFEKMDEYINSIQNSQFAHFTMNVKVQFDHFTNTHRLVNIAGDTAGLKSQASLRAPWCPGAGLERGTILNNKNMYMNLNRTQKTRFYKKGLNYIENGSLVTQKTFLSHKTNYDRVHTRSLFNHIEKEVKYILRNLVHEENTLRSRQSVAAHIKRYLKDIKVNDGIESAKLNIYPGINDEVHVEIAIKPTTLTEVINIRISNTGVNELAAMIT